MERTECHCLLKHFTWAPITPVECDKGSGVERSAVATECAHSGVRFELSTGSPATFCCTFWKQSHPVCSVVSFPSPRFYHSSGVCSLLLLHQNIRPCGFLLADPKMATVRPFASWAILPSPFCHLVPVLVGIPTLHVICARMRCFSQPQDVHRGFGAPVSPLRFSSRFLWLLCSL